MNSSFLNVYPKEIREALLLLVDFYDEFSKCIILYGSTATGELTYTTHNNKIELYSDVEFIIIPKNNYRNNDAINRKKLEKASKELVKENFPNIIYLSHIDVYLVYEDYFSTREPRISTFELKENGKILKGDNLLNELPYVGKDNYNPKIQNIEIVKALKILTINSYEWFLLTDIHTEKEKNDFCYFLYSSLLNVLRTLLPLYNIFKPTLETRMEALQEIKTDPKINEFFSDDLFYYFLQVYHEKESCSFRFDPKELFNLTYKAYTNLLCLELNCQKSMLINILLSGKSNLFWGSDQKKQQLASLTSFFISALNCIQSLIINRSIDDISLNITISTFDNLVSGQNALSLMNIIDRFKELEKKRWRIINSKD